MFDLPFEPEILLRLLNWTGPKTNMHGFVDLVFQSALACGNRIEM